MSAAFDPGTHFCTECGRPHSADDLAHFGAALICPDCKNGYVQKLREGVAPRATAPYAGFWIRFVAWMIDGIILMVAGSIVQFALLGSLATMRQPPEGASPEAVLGAMAGMLGLVFLVDIAIGCSYESFFVASGLSATPGKLALDLKVLRSNGTRLSLGRGVGRYFAKRLNMLTAGIGYIMAGFDSERRGLHDMICDTRVVRRQG
jgi:uncharacterized RDD family membrane protein YckC